MISGTENGVVCIVVPEDVCTLAHAVFYMDASRSAEPCEKLYETHNFVVNEETLARAVP